jgi:hypothetical protein
MVLVLTWALSMPHMISRWNVSSPRVRFVDVLGTI